MNHNRQKRPFPQPENRAALENAAAVKNLPNRKPPQLAETCCLHGQPVPADAVTVVFSQTAVQQIAAHSSSNLDCELGGALLGRAFRYEDRLYVDVQAGLPAVTKDHGPVHFTFTADAWAQLHTDRAAKYPNLDIVGWFHTHPDLGVFYSSDDVVVHSAAFTMPWHIGLVVDPVRRETAVFGWQAGHLKAYPGFYERLDRQAESILPWRYVQTAVWDHPYDYYPEEQQRAYPNEVYLPPNARPGLPSARPYLGFAIGALGFLLSFFLLVGWVVPLTREVNQLENTVIVLADKTLADSNALTCPDPRLRFLTPLTGQRIQIGTTIELNGTAVYPNAGRYQVQTRLRENGSWTLLNSVRRDTKLGLLAQWDTTSFPPGVYEVRLSAVDRNNIILPASPPCTILLEMTP